MKSLLYTALLTAASVAAQDALKSATYGLDNMVVESAGLSAIVYNIGAERGDIGNLDEYERDGKRVATETYTQLNQAKQSVSNGGFKEFHAYRFEGFVKVPSDGVWDFQIVSDDGSIVFVDDQQVINNDGVHSSLSREGSISLQAGWHKLEVKYYNNHTDSQLQLKYRTNGQAFNVVPADSLATSLKEEALDELADPSYRSEAAVDLPTNLAKGLQGNIYQVGMVGSMPDFSTLNPIETKVFNEIRWKTVYEEEKRRTLQNERAFKFDGFIYIDKTDLWYFELLSDDGSTLFIDNEKILDNDGIHGDVTKECSLPLSKGWHSININYFNYNVGASLRLRYKTVDGEYKDIHQNYFAHMVDAAEKPAVALPASNQLGLRADIYKHNGVEKVPDFSQLDVEDVAFVDQLNYGNQSENPEVLGSNTGAVFSGFVNVPSTGVWFFDINSDDGSLLSIDGLQAIDNDGLHGMESADGAWNLAEGWHAIELKYFNKGGGSGLKLRTNDVDSGDYYAIPADRLRHAVTTGDHVPGRNDVLSQFTWPQFWEQICLGDGKAQLAAQLMQNNYDTWREHKLYSEDLPEVCESGQECRNGIFAAAKEAATNEWITQLGAICDKFSNSWSKTKKSLESGYSEEFVCEPECYCEEIEQTYIDHVRLYREIQSEITDIETEIKTLVQKQTDVLVNCPDYAETKYEVPAEYLD